MDFWRSGRPRSFKTEQVLPGGKKPSIAHRIRHMYFPPWLPVAVIIVAVFGILGLLFITRSATGAPRIGQDHWHAAYSIYVCGDKQPNAPTWESGVHTHGDGIMHIHPFQSFEEGAGSRMVKWFEYGGGVLTQTDMREPGTSITYHNNDTCGTGTPDAGKQGVLQVFVNSAKLDDWSRFIPHDGDQIKIVFGPAAAIVQLDDRQVIAESEATRTIEINITGDQTSTKFSPSAPTMTAGETVKFLVHNQTTLSHQFRINGADGKQGTGDDFVAVPVGSDPTKANLGDILQPATDGFTVVRFDNAGQFQFEDPVSDTGAITTGTIIVQGAASATPTPAPGSQVHTDVTADMAMSDTGYTPAQITLAAGKVFGINLTNNGHFVHNLRIAGPDGQFYTADDILSPDISPLVPATPTPTPTAAPTGTATAGASTVAPTAATPASTPAAPNTGIATGKIDTPGTYKYQDDFHVSQITGTIIIQ
jgi:plastocyanin